LAYDGAVELARWLWIGRRRLFRAFAGVLATAVLLSCGAPDDAGDDEGPPPPMKDRRLLVDKLGRPRRLLIGHGNDLPGPEQNYDFRQAGIYTLPVSLDIHYDYLSGLKDEQGWPDQNPDGSFVTIIADIAAEKNVVPMFSLYQMATRGEQRFEVLHEEDFMTKYWAGARILFERLKSFAKPAIVHLEPDFWGYAQLASDDDPSAVPVLVGSKVPECRELADDLGGMGRCLLKLARTIAPNVAVGFHASGFGAFGRPRQIARFMASVGALESDFVAVDTLDRDAGCFEAHVDPMCSRNDGELYWDETNRRSPSFAEHFAWVKTIHERLGLPILWWQMPLGVPSATRGGTATRYRDNRVKYFFAHPDEVEAAGGFGVAFGVGAPNQTDITTDGGQFARAVTAYYDRPLPLFRP
jgi:hypothetical protein